MTKKARFFDFDETFTKRHTFKLVTSLLTQKKVPLTQANIWYIQNGKCTDDEIAENIKLYAVEAIRACLEAGDYVAFVTNNCMKDVILRYLSVGGLTPEEINRIPIYHSEGAKGVNPEFKRNAIAHAMANEFKDAKHYYCYDDDPECIGVLKELEANIPASKTFKTVLVDGGPDDSRHFTSIIHDYLQEAVERAQRVSASIASLPQLVGSSPVFLKRAHSTSRLLSLESSPIIPSRIALKSSA